MHPTKRAILHILTTFPFGEGVLEGDLTSSSIEHIQRATPLDYEKRFEDKLGKRPKQKRGTDATADKIAAEIYYEAYEEDLPALFGSIGRILRDYQRDEEYERAIDAYDGHWLDR